MSETTTLSRMPASVSTFCSRFFSALRSPDRPLPVAFLLERSMLEELFRVIAGSIKRGEAGGDVPGSLAAACVELSLCRRTPFARVDDAHIGDPGITSQSPDQFVVGRHAPVVAELPGTLGFALAVAPA